MYKILLINPPRNNVVSLETKKEVDIGEISAFPPIGLMYLGESLKQNNKAFQVRIIDAVVEKLTYKKLLDKVIDYNPRIIGITASTYTFYDVLKTAKLIKKRKPNISIVIGGPHMYIFSRETMEHKCFDFGVVGDGENVFSELCHNLYKKKPIKKLSGLLIRRNNQVLGGGIAILKNLDLIEIPAVDLINPFAYYNPVGKNKSVATICTSRGCPFRCTFCQVPQRAYKMRSIENVIKEIKIYLGMGINDFFFFDDLFNITKQRVVDFSKELISNKIKIRWLFRGRVDQIDDQVLSWAKKAGCHTISVGIEDATNKGLRAIKKNITIKQAFKAVNLIRKHKINCSANWIIGFPHHRIKKDIENLINTAIKIDSDYAQFSILQCLPGSELFNQGVKEKGIDKNIWKNYVLRPTKKFHPPIWEKNFTKEELYQFYEQAYRKFYFRPRFFIREIIKISSFSEVIYKLKAFSNVFFNN